MKKKEKRGVQMLYNAALKGEAGTNGVASAPSTTATGVRKNARASSRDFGKPSIMYLSAQKKTDDIEISVIIEKKMPGHCLGILANHRECTYQYIYYAKPSNFLYVLVFTG